MELAVAPAVAKYSWQQEIARFRPEFRAVVCEGKGSFRAPAAGEIVVLNPDILSGKVVLDERTDRDHHIIETGAYAWLNAWQAGDPRHVINSADRILHTAGV